MKKIIIITALVMTSTFIFAQVNFGVKAGINTFEVHDEVFESSVKDFTLAVQEAQYGFHAGIFLRAKLGPILIQPELIFNSDNIDYKFEQGDLGQTIVNQKYRTIDAPLLGGFKLGPIRILGGPVAHYHLESISSLEEQVKTNSFSDELTVGFQIGGGFDIKKLTFDIRYEANQSKLGESLSIGGQEIAFSQNRNRLVASVGYKF